MTTHTLAAEKLLTLTNAWTARAVEAVHALADAGEPVDQIALAVAFTCGSMAGQMLALNIPLDAVNAATSAYYEACEAALRERVPSYGHVPWPSASSIN